MARVRIKKKTQQRFKDGGAAVKRKLWRMTATALGRKRPD